MMDANSRNAKLAQFMTQEGENRYQLDVDSEDVEAARRQSVGDGGAETETLAKVMAQADAAQVSDESLERIARKMVKTSDSRADVKTLTSRLAALRNYLSGGSVDWAQAHGFVLDMAQQVMEGSAKKKRRAVEGLPRPAQDEHEPGKRQQGLQRGAVQVRQLGRGPEGAGKARREPDADEKGRGEPVGRRLYRAAGHWRGIVPHRNAQQRRRRAGSHGGGTRCDQAHDGERL